MIAWSYYRTLVRLTSASVLGKWAKLGQRGLPDAAVPELRHLRLADHDRVGRLDPVDHHVVLLRDEIGLGV